MRANQFFQNSRSLPKPLRYLLIAFAVALGLAAFEQAWAHRRAQVSDPGRGAEWIWAREVHPGKQNNPPEPSAFYAVRDLHLNATPQRAWLEITADEAYVVYLNGRWLGAGRYREAQPADLYPVGDWLRHGVNRIVIEARSQRGIGGLLVSLRADRRDRVLLRSGPAWRTFAQFEAAFFDPDQLLPGGDEPRVWGGHGTGRWRVEPAIERALPSAPVRATRVRNTSPRARWVDLTRSRRQFPRLGPFLIFDWGETVTGYLSLPLASTSEPGLLYCHEDRIPDPDRDPLTWMVRPIAGAMAWTSSEPQRFRYCLSVGLPFTTAPHVEPAPLLSPPPTQTGVFRIEPPLEPVLLDDPDAVWQRVRDTLREERLQRAREKDTVPSKDD